MESKSIHQSMKPKNISIYSEHFGKCPENVLEEFRRILINTHFENHSIFLCNHLFAIKKSKKGVVSENELREDYNKYYNELLELTESLLIICKSKTESVRIAISNPREQSKLPTSMNTIIERILIDKFKDAGLSSRRMTFEESKNILENNLSDDIDDFLKFYWDNIAKFSCANNDKIKHIDYTQINDDVINEYASLHQVEMEINTELIEEKLHEIRKKIKSFSQQGAPIKNAKLLAATHLFCEIKGNLSNQEYRTIYKSLDFFDLIPHDIKENWKNKKGYPEIQYMKSLRNQCKKYNILYFYK